MTDLVRLVSVDFGVPLAVKVAAVAVSLLPVTKIREFVRGVNMVCGDSFAIEAAMVKYIIVLSVQSMNASGIEVRHVQSVRMAFGERNVCRCVLPVVKGKDVIK